MRGVADRIVVTTMGSAREWPKLSQHPLDFHYIPSAMGHAPVLGLGLALAQPAREVITFNGDGCMLMSLGCLATIVASGATNYTLIVLENGGLRSDGRPTNGSRSGGGRFLRLWAAAPVSRMFRGLPIWRAGKRPPTRSLPRPVRDW